MYFLDPATWIVRGGGVGGVGGPTRALHVAPTLTLKVGSGPPVGPWAGSGYGSVQVDAAHRWGRPGVRGPGHPFALNRRVPRFERRTNRVEFDRHIETYFIFGRWRI